MKQKPMELRIEGGGAGRPWLDTTAGVSSLGMEMERNGWAPGDVGVLVPLEEWNRLRQIEKLAIGLSDAERERGIFGA